MKPVTTPANRQNAPLAIILVLALGLSPVALYYALGVNKVSGAGGGSKSSSAPLDANAFITGLAGFDSRYEAAPNDIKKSEVFSEARAWDKAFFKDTTEITDWRGVVNDMITVKGGDHLSLKVELDTDGGEGYMA